MTLYLLQLALFSGLLIALTKPLGLYLFRVYEGEMPGLARIERALLRLCGVDPNKEQTWLEYSFALLLFSAIGVLVSFLLLRLQGSLPLNPQGLPGVEAGLAFNTAVSFTTNTNWQAYSGETTMSYLSQMLALTWHNFISAGVGIGVALVIARGLTRTPGPDGNRGVGNFWVDLLRSIWYVLLPLCLLLALFFASQGVIQNLLPYQEITTLEGTKQLIAMGPVASQEAIKELGTNGGGFFNANSAHPFENPSWLTNFVQMLAIFSIPAALTYTYGKMAKDSRQGWALLAAMFALFLTGAVVTFWAESNPNPALAASLDQSAGNMEGKETRFGVASSALFATVTTGASCGAVNSMHDSFSPLGGLVPLLNIQLGEIIFGGVGAGLYGMLIFVLLSVFIAGLMVGRTPEYLGKKIEAREMKLAMLYILIFPVLILGLSAWSSIAPTYGTSALNNAGPHGLSEILYAYTSATGNNGSAFAGLNANTSWYNITLGLAMLLGRFFMIIPVLAIAGSMLNKKTTPPGPGTLPTNGATFVGLLLAVIIIVGALTFFPALSLGPIVEHLLLQNGKTF